MKKTLSILILAIVSLYITMPLSSAVSTLQQQIDDASPGSTIYLNKDYTENISISKNLTLIGTNITINGTCNISSGSAVTLKNLKFVGNTDNYLINISDNSNTITLDSIELINNGNGVLIDDNATNTNLTIKNSNITSEKAINGRALGIHGPGSNVRIDNNSILTTTGGTGASTIHINVGSTSNTATIQINNSTVNSENYYAYFVWQGNVNASLQNSTIRGYSAIYLKVDSMNTMNIKSSKIIGLTRYSGPSDDFGAIVFESANNTINIGNNSFISNEYINNAKSLESLILFSTYGNASNNTINLSDVTLTNTTEKLNEFIGYNENNNLINITDSTKFLNGKSDTVCLTRKINGVLGNVYLSIDDAIDYAQNNSLVLQLQPGTYVTKNNQTLNINEITFLAFSYNLKKAAELTFPSVALASNLNDKLNIYANSISLKNENENVKLYLNTKKQLEVIFTPDSTTEKKVSWSIENPNIATISDDGLLIAKKVGITTLTINSNGKIVKYKITVLSPVFVIISLFIFAVIIIILFIYLLM